MNAKSVYMEFDQRILSDVNSSVGCMIVDDITIIGDSVYTDENPLAVLLSRTNGRAPTTYKMNGDMFVFRNGRAISRVHQKTLHQHQYAEYSKTVYYASNILVLEEINEC